ncbi:NUDIX hydrolase [Pseudooceanicola sp. C21-150M6]|uniref:NUDIX hydrolase n=1 Tax=Pseudooceanicola sp. C21-150M6 TaxID=3434355 RepID=UPI003D7F55E5
METEFNGAKLILFVGRSLLVIERDDIDTIPWPGHLDFPGGGREGEEDPEGCVLRETQEELGLVLIRRDLIWSRRVERSNGVSWFYVARLPDSAAAKIVFGDEGQGWFLMEPDRYPPHPRAIPHFADQLQAYLSAA